MIHFSIGDQVVIRHGQRRGQLAEVVAVQPAQVYQVKLRDGSVLFFSRLSLQTQNEQRPNPAGDALSGLHSSLRN